MPSDAKKALELMSDAERKGQGNDFELIPTVKWTLHVPQRAH